MHGEIPACKAKAMQREADISSEMESVFPLGWANLGGFKNSGVAPKFYSNMSDSSFLVWHIIYVLWIELCLPRKDVYEVLISNILEKPMPLSTLINKSSFLSLPSVSVIKEIELYRHSDDITIYHCIPFLPTSIKMNHYLDVDVHFLSMHILFFYHIH